MLTRFVRTQLVIFSIAAIIGMTAMVVVYMQVPTLLGIGRMTVTLELPETGGLYRFSNVTYRGVQVGKVTDVRATRAGAEATLSLAATPKIPADLQATVRSVSAVGEQYVDLLPRTDSGPYLRDGSVIPMRDIQVPQRVARCSTRSALCCRAFPGQIEDAAERVVPGLNGAGDDLAALLESSSKLSAEFDGLAERARALIEDGRPCWTPRRCPPRRCGAGPPALPG